MKLVTKFFDLSEAEKTSNRMRRAGVMTVVTSKRSHRLSPGKTGAVKVGLWSVLDEQYLDAVRLLEDPNHKPERIISQSEMREIQKLATAQISTRLKELLENSATWVFGGILLLLTMFVVIGMINDA